MKEPIFRALAGILAALLVSGVVMASTGAAQIGGGLTTLLTLGVLGILFAAYAVLGPSRANRLLARILWLHELPGAVFQKTIGRFVESPSLEPQDESQGAYIARLRAGVGQELLLLPSVAVVVRDPEGRVLLVRARESGEWSLPAGGIEPGESPEAAARRELQEECGIDCDDLRLAAALGGPTFRHTYANGDQVEYSLFVFSGTTTAEPVPEDVDEIDRAAFFSREDAPPLALPYPTNVLWG